MAATCQFDHLVLGAHTLAQGAAFVESLLGVKPQSGGKHIAMGTHNMLLRLGAKSYLEVIAIDPDAVAPQRPRWFGLDNAAMRTALIAQPRLLTWVVRSDDIEATVQNCPLAPGAIHRMSRGKFSWRITIPGDGELIGDGLIPGVIQWDGAAHPADKLDDRGCELVRLEGLHPSPASIAPALAALGLDQTISLAAAKHSGLIATLRSLRGICNITS
jgi:hypothetical protein